jgi:hypothetical protein
MQAERHEPHAPLPHQGLWFILLLIAMLLLLSKNVATDDQWVIAYNSTLIPIAYPSTEKL